MGNLVCLSTMSSEARVLYAAFIKNLSSNEPSAVKMRDTFRSDNGQAEIMKSLQLLNLPSAKEMSEHIATFIKSHLDNNSALEKLAEKLNKDALTVAGNCGTSPLVSVAVEAGKTTTCNGSQKTQDSGLVGKRFLCRLPSLPDSPLTGFQDPRLKNPTELLKRGWVKLDVSCDKTTFFELRAGTPYQLYILNSDGSQRIRTLVPLYYGNISSWIEEWIEKSPTGEISRSFLDATIGTTGIGKASVRYSANDKDADEKVNRALAMAPVKVGPPTVKTGPAYVGGTGDNGSSRNRDNEDEDGSRDTWDAGGVWYDDVWSDDFPLC